MVSINILRETNNIKPESWGFDTTFSFQRVGLDNINNSFRHVYGIINNIYSKEALTMQESSCVLLILLLLFTPLHSECIISFKHTEGNSCA
jgi:hypothetical protein